MAEIQSAFNPLKSSQNEKPPRILRGGFFMVFPKGFEPPSSEPESDILSIELRKRIAYCCKNIKLFRILIIGFFEKKKAFLQTLNRSGM